MLYYLLVGVKPTYDPLLSFILNVKVLCNVDMISNSTLSAADADFIASKEHTAIFVIVIAITTKTLLTKSLKSVGMTLAKVKEQDGMTLAKVKEQDGTTLAKVNARHFVS